MWGGRGRGRGRSSRVQLGLDSNEYSRVMNIGKSDGVITPHYHRNCLRSGVRSGSS